MSPSRWCIRSCLPVALAVALASCDGNAPSDLAPTDEMTTEQAHLADLQRLTDLIRAGDAVGSGEASTLLARIQGRYSIDPSLLPTERPALEDLPDVGAIMREVRDRQKARAGMVNLEGPAAVGSGILRVPGQYATIQAAVDADSPGDDIQVSAGVYNETVFIMQDGIRLSGIGLPVIMGSGGIINLGDGNVVVGFSTVLTAFGIANLGNNVSHFAANQVYGALAGVWCLQTTQCWAYGNQVTLTVFGMVASIVALLDDSEDEGLFVGFHDGDFGYLARDVTDTYFIKNRIEFSGVGAVAVGALPYGSGPPSNLLPPGYSAYEADLPSHIEDLVGLEVLRTNIQENDFFQNAVQTALVNVRASTVMDNQFMCALEDIFRLDDALSTVRRNKFRRCADGFTDLPVSHGGGRIF